MPNGSSTSLVLANPATFVAPAPRVIGGREEASVAGILRLFSQIQTRRNPFAQQWEEVAELILPTSRNTFFYNSYNTPGQKKTQQQVDATGALALHRFCAIADSLVTPRNMQWHGLAADPYVMKDRASKLWLEGATATLFDLRYADIANFAAQNYNNWQSLGAFGNSTMFIDEFDNRWHGGVRGLRYKSCPLGETFFIENHQGKVNGMIRWFRNTAAQAVEKWGLEALPQNLLPALQQGNQWLYNFLHCVLPRTRADYDPERLDHRAMPFSSHYVSIEGKCLMQPESGYRVFPYAVSRYDQTPGEVEGRGPGQIVLPALKTLNAEKATFLKQGHRAADPVLLTADDGIVDVNLRPGATNKGGVNRDGKLLVHALPTGDIQISKEMMGEERSIIDDVFLVSLFKVLSEHPNMTATQVVELVNEKGMLVAPTLGRQHSEYVGSMVPRELELASSMGMLPPMPPRLREAVQYYGLGAIRVTDTSPLAKAAHMGEAAGFNRWIENLTKVATEMQDPAWLDPVNGTQAAIDMADIYSVRTSWTATPEQMAQKVKARSAQQQQQARIQALPAEAAMVKAQATMAQKAPQAGGLPA